MAGYVRRYTTIPTIDVIKRIEGPVIVDLTPPAPLTGLGSGTVLAVGEFEDGPFAAQSDGSNGVLEVFGSSDLVSKFGAFGYSYASLVSQNPSSRRHLAEFWNGNGFLKLFKLRSQRLLVARVDTSVGSVAFEPLATIEGGPGLFRVTDGQALSATSGSTAASDAVSAKVATAFGKGSAGFSTIIGGETIGIRVDGGPQINVVFDSTMITGALVRDRINAVYGATIAALVSSNLNIFSQRLGYGATVELIDVVPGSLFKLGQIAGVFGDEARVYGGTGAIGTIAAGDKAIFTIDGAASPITVTFAGAPADAAAAATVINTQLGANVAYAMPSGVLMLRGVKKGLGNGSIILAVGSPDALVKLGFAAGTTNALSNVVDSNATPTSDIVVLLNGSAGLAGISVKASVAPSGDLRLVATTFGASLLVATGALSTALGLAPLDTTVAPSAHGGGTIPAGTRVRTDAGLEWVTMQSLDIPADDLGPFTARVRPGLDDGTAVGTSANTITTIVDNPTFANLKVTNAAALGAALTEAQMDVAYITALGKTLDEKSTAREANYLLVARRSDAVVREGKSNALSATANGALARKFITGDPLGTMVNQAIANVAQFRSDRVFYTSKGWKVLVPQIAALGTAGGLGFTADGVITVRPDGPLTTLCAMLAPEENPGQATGLIDDFFEVNTFGETLSRESYEAYKAAGISVPRIDRQSGSVYQSGVTSSLDTGKATMARRKMADFIQDQAAEFLNPYIKKLNRQERRDQIVAQWVGFLSGLKSVAAPDQQRIEDYSVDDGVNAGNTADTMALGLFYVKTIVRTLSSLDNIIFVTEVGESAIVINEQT